MQSSRILYIAQALESMFFYMCFKILYSFKMFFKMSFHAAMMLICPFSLQEIPKLLLLSVLQHPRRGRGPDFDD